MLYAVVAPAVAMNSKSSKNMIDQTFLFNLTIWRLLILMYASIVVIALKDVLLKLGLFKKMR